MKQCITLCNQNGLSASFSPYGARWVSMYVPDRSGHIEDVLLGFDELTGYQRAQEQYYGAVIGRVCGRIKGADFDLGNKHYQLVGNDVYGDPQPNHLHGGLVAFHNRFWDVSSIGINKQNEQTVLFTLWSPNGEEGYPGNLKVSVRYTLTNHNSLEMECRAITDQLTPINMTNHSFFNLAGVRNHMDILSHKLKVCSAQLIECDDELLPTGTFLSLDGTKLDFRKERLISEALSCDYQKISERKGFSLAYALNRDSACPLVAELYDEDSGRRMSLYSNQASLQVYTGYLMNGADIGKNGIPYYSSAGIALEPQGYPDAVHWSNFPSILVDRDEEYVWYTKYQFSIDNDQ